MFFSKLSFDVTHSILLYRDVLHYITLYSIVISCALYRYTDCHNVNGRLPLNCSEFHTVDECTTFIKQAFLTVMKIMWSIISFHHQPVTYVINLCNYPARDLIIKKIAFQLINFDIMFLVIIITFLCGLETLRNNCRYNNIRIRILLVVLLSFQLYFSTPIFVIFL